jgi:hypothetical protein
MTPVEIVRLRRQGILGWHFTDGVKLRDGQELVVGKLCRHEGPLVMCDRGYHASVDSVDALYHAPGFTVSRVQCGGEIIRGDDKLVCSERRALWVMNVKTIVLDWTVRVTIDALKQVKKFRVLDFRVVR